MMGKKKKRGSLSTDWGAATQTKTLCTEPSPITRNRWVPWCLGPWAEMKSCFMDQETVLETSRLASEDDTIPWMVRLRWEIKNVEPIARLEFHSQEPTFSRRGLACHAFCWGYDPYTYLHVITERQLFCKFASREYPSSRHGSM